MTEHKGLPISGYKAQSDKSVATVNVNKELEERVLRQIDEMANHFNEDGKIAYDQRMISIARTGVQEAFMWLNRAVFQPNRIKLPEDAE